MGQGPMTSDPYEDIRDDRESDIVSVLLVPTDGDPYGLLADGPCGARPPTVWEHQGRWGRVALRVKPARVGLVLAWDHLTVEEGWTRLGCRLQCSMPVGMAAVRAALEEALYSAAPRRLRATRREVGTVVLVDADGREVAR